MRRPVVVDVQVSVVNDVVSALVLAQHGVGSVALSGHPLYQRLRGARN